MLRLLLKSKYQTKMENEIMASAKKNGEILDVDGLPDFAKWEEEQVGFAPYWNPEKDKWFYARIIEKDERDSEFVRYLMQAGVDTPCKRGPADGAEDITVKKGEYFTISVYFSLQDLFDLYLETGIRPFMKVTAKDTVKTSTAGRTCWLWSLLVSPETKAKTLAAKEKIRLLSDAGEFPAKEMT